jgi:hypothetical protein
MISGSSAAGVIATGASGIVDFSTALSNAFESVNAVGAVKVSMDGISDFFSTGAGSGACGMKRRGTRLPN